MELLVLDLKSRGGLYNIRTKTNHSIQQLCFRSVAVTIMRDNEKARYVSCTMKCPSFCAYYVVHGKQMLGSLNYTLFLCTRNAECKHHKQSSPITHDDFIEGDEDPLVWFTAENKTINYTLNFPLR